MHVEDKISFLTFANVTPITLISDFGPDSLYVGMLKGSILRRMPDARVVDLTHSIRQFDAVHAVCAARVDGQFSPGHRPHCGCAIVGDPRPSPPHSQDEGQYFIGADSGVFKSMGLREPEAVYDLSNVQTDADEPTFPERALFVPAATHLAKGGIPEMLGRPAACPNKWRASGLSWRATPLWDM